MVLFKCWLRGLCLALLAAACRPNPCQNGARCKKGRTRNKFECVCPSGYSGQFCQIGKATTCSIPYTLQLNQVQRKYIVQEYTVVYCTGCSGLTFQQICQKD